MVIFCLNVTDIHLLNFLKMMTLRGYDFWTSVGLFAITLSVSVILHVYHIHR